MEIYVSILTSNAVAMSELINDWRKDHPYFKDHITVDEASKLFNLSVAFIQALIDKRHIEVTNLTKFSNEQPGILIGSEAKYQLKKLSENPESTKKLLEVTPSYISMSHPEIISYLPFHDFVDRFCWLIKLFYSDKTDIKKKSYRLDVLFQNFLVKNAFNATKLTNVFKGRSNSLDKSRFHLKKAWYNEVVRSTPINKDLLNIGTNGKGRIHEDSFASWNIIQSYYSIYEFMNSMVFCLTEDLSTKEHSKSIRFYNSDVINNKRIKSTILYYPFDLTSICPKRISYPPHTKFQYARYPRDSTKSIQGIEEDVLESLKRLGEEKSYPLTSLIDYLYEFRVWSNYTGIETIIRLENGYLLDYLYKNLATLIFFVAGISELSALSAFGESEYVRILDEFCISYLLKQENCKNNQFLTPVLIRHRIYHHLGFIKQPIKYLVPIDPIKFI